MFRVIVEIEGGVAYVYGNPGIDVRVVDYDVDGAADGTAPGVGRST